eukprot:gnl/MRDRNA2_/MRDRNA2_83073_c0_seq1.p1 gnl/MRDRNA2_/MRDRNA2_83073_c0~~gnl/MRDRNA2_/MRDRNA2_83073_c0_seq1.p1  ORF type:complete len:698 (-),score=140.62 gnl/MRDRNA2_/MRDRNA2_83073_c0_seq1:278-2371(-)
MHVLSYVLTLSTVAAAKKPNIIFIMTDDQDLEMDSLKYMPHVQQLLAEEGMTFQQHRVNSPICCPSRTTTLTGMCAHSTNVTSVMPPMGSIWKSEKNVGDKYVGIQLQKLGYTTHAVGKMMSMYTVADFRHKGPGWDDWHVLMDPFTYNFNRTVMSVNGIPHFFPGKHQTEVIAAKVKQILSDQRKKEEAARAQKKNADPFFLYLTPVAPHDEEVLDVGCRHPGGIPFMKSWACLVDTPPSPLPRHVGLFPNTTIPRTPIFNPKDASAMKQKAPGWVQSLHLMNDTQVSWLDEHYRQRLRALQGVDEMVADIVSQLEEQEMLDNTYIFYTADNGFHLGHFRLPPAKMTAYENDIHVPLIVRGPGVPKGAVSHELTSNVDFFGAFTSIAGIDKLPEWVEGVPNFLAKPTEPKREMLNFEYFGPFVSQRDFEFSIPDGFEEPGIKMIPMEYSGVVVRPGAAGGMLHLKYIFWCGPGGGNSTKLFPSNVGELYNLTADPMETTNLLLGEQSPDIKRIEDRLNAITQVLRTCSGQACHQPLTAFAGPSMAAPSTLQEALNPVYDDIFKAAPRPHFEICTTSHTIENERPVYRNSSTLAEVVSVTPVKPPATLHAHELYVAAATELTAEAFGPEFEVAKAEVERIEAELQTAQIHKATSDSGARNGKYFFGAVHEAEALLRSGVQLHVLEKWKAMSGEEIVV